MSLRRPATPQPVRAHAGPLHLAGRGRHQPRAARRMAERDGKVDGINIFMVIVHVCIINILLLLLL